MLILMIFFSQLYSYNSSYSLTEDVSIQCFVIDSINHCDAILLVLCLWAPVVVIPNNISKGINQIT